MERKKTEHKRLWIAGGALTTGGLIWLLGQVPTDTIKKIDQWNMDPKPTLTRGQLYRATAEMIDPISGQSGVLIYWHVFICNGQEQVVSDMGDSYWKMFEDGCVYDRKESRLQ